MTHDARDGSLGNAPSAAISRRGFLSLSAVGVAGSLVAPALFPKRSSAAATSASDHTLVTVFLRGGCDGLSLCPPFGDPDYAAMRPSIGFLPPDARGSKACLDLDGFFGLAPAMAPLLPVFRTGHLLVAHAVGSTDPTRSHFHAQRIMELGEAQGSSTSASTGWIARHVNSVGNTRGSALAIGHGVSTALAGVREIVTAPFDASLVTPSNGSRFGYDTECAFARSLRIASEAIRSDRGVRAIALDLDGWDTHTSQGPIVGTMANSMSKLSRGLRAFYEDICVSASRNVTVLVLSEFGRRVHENDSGGTEHGRGGVMLAMGGGVLGGRVLADWPGLSPERLDDGVDLRVTTSTHTLIERILSNAGTSALL